MIDIGKIIGYGFNMVISEIWIWKITVTLHLIFDINARFRGRQANFVISSGGQANCSTADKPGQQTWIHAAAAMNAATDIETAKTNL